jgi:poly(A) polymerase Pap1
MLLGTLNIVVYDTLKIGVHTLKIDVDSLEIVVLHFGRNSLHMMCNCCV